MIRVYSKRVLDFLAGYAKENWGAPLIALFIFLLIVTAASLSLGLVSLSDSITTAAYYVLIGGIILQIVCFLKNRKEQTENTNV
jgi:hypothetical protein